MEKNETGFSNKFYFNHHSNGGVAFLFFNLQKNLYNREEGKSNTLFYFVKAL